jgi:hypothetical protein
VRETLLQAIAVVAGVAGAAIVLIYFLRPPRE